MREDPILISVGQLSTVVSTLFWILWGFGSSEECSGEYLHIAIAAAVVMVLAYGCEILRKYIEYIGRVQ